MARASARLRQILPRPTNSAESLRQQRIASQKDPSWLNPDFVAQQQSKMLVVGQTLAKSPGLESYLRTRVQEFLPDLASEFPETVGKSQQATRKQTGIPAHRARAVISGFLVGDVLAPVRVG